MIWHYIIANRIEKNPIEKISTKSDFPILSEVMNGMMLQSL